MQEHLYDITQPENLLFMEEFRQLLDLYPDATAVGEVGCGDTHLRIPEYTVQGKRLHMVYTFRFLNDNFSPAYFREYIEQLEAHLEGGWACFAFSNHDVMRVVQRWNKAHPDHQDEFARMLLALLGSLRGSLCLYQGEELGLEEADIPFEKLQDPYGIRFWPEFKGRDGCRTPMPWNGREHAGFTTGEPWLPIPASHVARAVERQEGDPASLLHHYRRFLQWRRGQEALTKGSIRFIDVPSSLLAFEREAQGERLLCVFNLSPAPQRCQLDGQITPLADAPVMAANWSAPELELPPYGVFFAKR